MFFIFGWGHPQVKELGPVQEETCKHCHNTDIWQLKEVARYFTLFFIPVFPHDREHLYHCPICSHGKKLSREELASYKAIAQVNADCLKKKISEEERLRRLAEIHKAMQQRDAEQHAQDKEGSKKWSDLVSARSSEELQHIIDHKQEEYNAAFIIAAKEELERRSAGHERRA